MLNDPFHEGLVDCLPRLQRYARFLARDAALADDLVNDTALRAISARSKFKPGTNLRGWLFVILRNCHFNNLRRGAMHPTVSLEICRSEASISGGQEETLEMRDLERHFRALPATGREALILVGVNGHSYEEAAEVSGCAVGTMKSRVSRARLQLRVAIAVENEQAAA